MDKTRKENNMNTRNSNELINRRSKEDPMKTLKNAVQAVMVAGLLVLGLGLMKQAQASGNPDAMTITVTPGGVTYAVAITSPEVQGYDFGTVTIGQTTVSTKSISVQNFGNISEFLSLGVQDATPSVAWTNASSPANVTYTMQGLFQTNQPLSANFAGANNNVPSAPPGTASGKFGEGAVKTLPLASQTLWLQLQMPTGVAESAQHSLVLAINGQSS